MGQKAVLLRIAAAALMGFLLPVPANRLAALVILAPTAVCLTADTIGNRNQWKK